MKWSRKLMASRGFSVGISNNTIPLTLQSMNHVQPNIFYYFSWWGSNLMKMVCVLCLKCVKRFPLLVYYVHNVLFWWPTPSVYVLWLGRTGVSLLCILACTRIVSVRIISLLKKAPKKRALDISVFLPFPWWGSDFQLLGLSGILFGICIATLNWHI